MISRLRETKGIAFVLNYVHLYFCTVQQYEDKPNLTQKLMRVHRIDMCMQLVSLVRSLGLR